MAASLSIFSSFLLSQRSALIAENPVRSAAGLLDLSLMRLPCKSVAGILSAASCRDTWLLLPRAPPGTLLLHDAQCPVMGGNVFAFRTSQTSHSRMFPPTSLCGSESWPLATAQDPRLSWEPLASHNQFLKSLIPHVLRNTHVDCGYLPPRLGAPWSPAHCVHSCLGVCVCGGSPAYINLHSPASKMHCFN